MSNELVTLDLSQLPSTQIGSDEVFNELAKGSDFLGRLQLYTKGAAIDRGLIGPGRYGIPVSDDEITDLGSSIDLLPLARRPKAIDMSGDPVIVNYDPQSPEFQRIQEAASETQGSRCMYGPDFLVYERSTGQFLVFFCGNKSSRSEAKKLFPFLPLTAADIERRRLTDQQPHGPIPVTLRVKLVEKKGQYSWHVPVVGKCSTPIVLPDPQQAVAEIQKFLTIKDNGVEAATGAPKRRAR